MSEVVLALKDYYDLLANNLLVLSINGVFFLWLLIWVIYKLKIIDNQHKYVDAVDQVFLEVRIEELNERSPLAMEQVFAALHAIHQNFTWGERLDGRVVLWMSCEIVSIGGKVSYIFKIPERYRNLLESAIFAQYPKAEINQIEDYLAHMPHLYDSEKAEFEFWGTQLNKKKDNAYPIRTYEGFEHPDQKTFIDPLANVIEVMSNIQPHELMVSQLVIRPINDDWKLNIKPLLDKLKGVPDKHDSGWFDSIMFGPFRFVIGALVDLIAPQEEKTRTPTPKEEPPSQMLHKTEGEKQIIAAIEHGLGKITFEAKLRVLYLAPKGKLNKALRIPEIVGAYRNFDDINLNGIKPDLGHTWTDVAYKINPKWEAPIIRFRVWMRKRHFWHNFLPRSVWRGSGNTFFNTEELASLYHFPVSPNVRVSQLERVQGVKSAPPADLPIGY